MEKSKFNIFCQQIINSLNNSNALDQQYFNDCNTLEHDEPIKFEDSWIQIFTKYSDNNKKSSIYNNEYYFAYILDDYGVVKKYLPQVFTSKDQCLEDAKLTINNKKQMQPLQINYARLRKSQHMFAHKPHTRNYGFINLVNKTEFSIQEQNVSKLIQLLNNSDLVKEYKAKYNELIYKANCGNKAEFDELIDESYTFIDIQMIKSVTLPADTNKILFRLILPYTSLNWFNRIFREALEAVRSSDIVKEDVDETIGITKKDTLLSLLYDLASEAYAIGYGDGSSEHEDRDILEDNSIHDTIVKIEELFDNNIMENKDEK